MTRAVLVAGGAGYIGSHVCKALKAVGYLPVTLDNLCTGHRDFVRFGPFVEASVADVEVVAHIIRHYQIKAVINLAGSIEVAESVRNPLKYYENNFARKVAFLRVLDECNINAFVFSSTAAVYGEPHIIPIPENHPLNPKNPYGRTKMIFEQLLADFHLAGGPRWIALRYFNAACASPDGDIGEKHEPETHLIPRACMAALGGSPPLDVFGNDYDTPDGTAIRDYVHVCDLADAHVLAVQALLDGVESDIYNLGNGEGVSVGEMLTCFSALGYAVPHCFKPRRPGDPARLIADSRAARTKLAWKPSYTDIHTIVSSAYQWHKSQTRVLYKEFD